MANNRAGYIGYSGKVVRRMIMEP